jgi:hypothetical protein
MYKLDIWKDINDAVRNAMVNNWHLLDEDDLIERSDALLTTLPVVGKEQPSTAALLKRYQGRLQQELCVGRQPRITNLHLVQEELVEITRGVVVAIEGSEGISIESAVYLALVIRARGLANFCATPPALGARL